MLRRSRRRCPARPSRRGPGGRRPVCVVSSHTSVASGTTVRSTASERIGVSGTPSERAGGLGLAGRRRRRRGQLAEEHHARVRAHPSGACAGCSRSSDGSPARSPLRASARRDRSGCARSRGRGGRSGRRSRRAGSSRRAAAPGPSPGSRGRTRRRIVDPDELVARERARGLDLGAAVVGHDARALHAAAQAQAGELRLDAGTGRSSAGRRGRA